MSTDDLPAWSPRNPRHESPSLLRSPGPQAGAVGDRPGAYAAGSPFIGQRLDTELPGGSESWRSPPFGLRLNTLIAKAHPGGPASRWPSSKPAPKASTHIKLPTSCGPESKSSTANMIVEQAKTTRLQGIFQRLEKRRRKDVAQKTTAVQPSSTLLTLLSTSPEALASHRTSHIQGWLSMRLICWQGFC
jgi:hypothetical protein